MPSSIRQTTVPATPLHANANKEYRDLKARYKVLQEEFAKQTPETKAAKHDVAAARIETPKLKDQHKLDLRKPKDDLNAEYERKYNELKKSKGTIVRARKHS